MPVGFTNSGIAARSLKHFRVTVDMSGYMTEESTRGGAVSPNGNFPTTDKYFYSTNLTGGKSTTRATTDTVVTSVTAQAPTDSGEIFDSITVAQITTTKLISGEDS